MVKNNKNEEILLNGGIHIAGNNYRY